MSFNEKSYLDSTVIIENNIQKSFDLTFPNYRFKHKEKMSKIPKEMKEEMTEERKSMLENQVYALKFYGKILPAYSLFSLHLLNRNVDIDVLLEMYKTLKKR